MVDTYIPYYPKEKTCLHDTLLIGKYERILQDLPDYFFNVKTLNFDIIHHESRGDPLPHSREYYQQIREEHFKNIRKEDDRYNFIRNAIKSRIDDIFIQKDIMKKLKKNLEKKVFFYHRWKKKCMKEKIENIAILGDTGS